jgi:hypothetical protein
VQKPSIFILRVLLAVLVAAYAFTLYMQWHWPWLSIEARQYQDIAISVTSGPDLNYALEKLCWLLANLVGALGIALMFFRIRSGVPMLLAGLPLLIAADLFGAPEVAYPFLGRVSTTVLWSVSAATWGCVVTYALVGGKILFSKQTKDGSSSPESAH